MKTKSLAATTFALLSFLVVACMDKAPSSSQLDAQTEKAVPLHKKTQSQRTRIFSPEEELAGFTVPDGFIVELVASEKDGIVNPIDLTFDNAGRLWTQTGSMYPLDPVADIKWQQLLKLMNNPEAQEKDPSFKRILDLYRGITKGEDKILVLSGLYDNQKVKTNIWADGLAIPQSILPYKNGAYVAQGSEMFFLSDTDEDGKADKRTPLFQGFGFTDTHTMSHTLIRGPGDWIHFSQGALNKGEVRSLISGETTRLDFSKIARFSLNGEKMELVNAGLNNIWGFQLRANGQWYGTEANDLGYSIVPMEVGTGYPGIGGERLRSYQPWMPELHKFRIGGTGISGLAFADDISGSFPEEWKDVAFLANPIASNINAVRINRNTDGTVTAEHLPDFLSSKDDWFRPVNMEFGPDGCLYIADWYNKIVSHNELPTTHPDRDKSHGRIWRVRHESQKTRKIPNFYEVKTNKLVDYLKSPSLWAKRAAWHQISDRSINETDHLSEELHELVLDSSQDEITRILALWSLEGISNYHHDVMAKLIESPFENLKREAIRSLASFSIDIDEVTSLLKKPSEHENPMIRSQVLRTLEEVRETNAEAINILITVCKPALNGNQMGGSYERLFERYLARKALESYPNELLAFLNSPMVEDLPAENILWASQALPQKSDREYMFLKYFPKVDLNTLDEPTFIVAASMLDNQDIYDLVKPILSSEKNAEKNVRTALKHLGQVMSNELSAVFQQPVVSLLKSKDKDLENLGLNATVKLNIKGTAEVLGQLETNNEDVKRLNLLIQGFQNEPRENAHLFEGFAQNESLPTTVRSNATKALAQNNPGKARLILESWLPSLIESQQREVTKVLSSTVNGSILLRNLFKQSILNEVSFDLPSAERVFNLDTNNALGQSLLEKVNRRIVNERKEFNSKLDRFLAIAQTESGNPRKGKMLFQTCLLCHRVGDNGQDIAPALDGSAGRENEALLTAILNPDAALESSYAVYRVIENDGSTSEGYMTQKDSKGTTLAFMGGSTTFIPSNDIKSQGFITGRSFMPKGLLDNYTDDQAADLLAYIKTLN